MIWKSPRLVYAIGATLAAFAASAALAAPASAAPVWSIDSYANSNVEPGGSVVFVVAARNNGDVPTTAGAGDECAIGGEGCYVLRAEAPAGITFTGVSGTNPSGTSCSISGGGSAVTCQNPGGPASSRRITHKDWRALNRATFTADVDPAATGLLTARFSIYGGGAVLPNGAACASAAAPPPGLPECASSALTVNVTDDPASFGVESFDGQVAADHAGSVFTQAAATPYSASTELIWNSETDLNDFDLGPGSRDGISVDPPKDVVVDLPVGLVGSPASVATCTFADLAEPETGGNLSNQNICDPASQVGLVEVYSRAPGIQNLGPVAVYNMATGGEAPARFAFKVAGTIVILDASVRSESDYGISLATRNTSQGLSLRGVGVTVWGVPADPSHDADRSCPSSEQVYHDGPSVSNTNASGSTAACPDAYTPRPPETALLRTPSSCTGPVDTTAHTSSWHDPAASKPDGSPELTDASWKSKSFTSHEPPGFPLPESEWGDEVGTTGCNQVPFNPQVSVEATSTVADSPTGLAVDISIPQTSDPDVLGSSDLKDTVVTLPEGFTLNPSAAGGLKACTLEEIDFDGRNTEPDCPKASKIGTTTINTPLLEDPMEGSIYQAEPDDPDKAGKENPFDTLVAYYIVAEGPGTVIKLPGKVELDEDTGQIVNTFEDNPQLPFSNFHVEFFDGPRSPLATPPTCMSGQMETELTPWARPNSPVTRTNGLAITSMPDGEPCVSNPADRPFDPTMNAGVINPVAGSFSPFVFILKREDGHQEFLSTEVMPPAGLTAKLAGVPYCPEANIAAGTCGNESRIGTAITGAGAGSSPFYTTQNPGKVYLAGPYKGAPLSMVIHDPVVAGPFDLSDITVRAAIHVDPRTAQLTVVSDPIPQIVDGIPLRIRDLRIRMDRDEFTVAPTDCSPKQVLATVHGSHGGIANLSNRFQVGDCANLGFRPRLGLALKGRRQVRTGGHPAVRAVVRQAPGQAAIRAARVALPKSLALDPENAQALCEFEDGTKPDLENHCPEGSIVGRARAHTPLLDRPLVGNVYFVKNVRIDPDTGNEIRTLPMIVTALRGQIAINLVGESSTTRSGRLVNTFAGVPDAPIRRFNLNIRGGRNGILAVTRTRRSTINLCQRPRSHRANTGWRGHNNKLSRYRVRVKTPCRTAQRKRQLRLRRAAAKRRATARRDH